MRTLFGLTVCLAQLTLVALATTGIAWAQSTVKVTGQITHRDTIPASSFFNNYDITFECTGTPTCTGKYTTILSTSICANKPTITDAIEIDGLDLSKPGNSSVRIIFKNGLYDLVFSPAGCQFRGVTNVANPFPITWDGSTGTFNFFNPPPTATETNITTGSFTADFAAASPVFSLSVSNIADITANASAQIQFRAQDVGQQQSVFVFAMAPINVVQNPIKSAGLTWEFRASPKDLPVQCVLAQLSASGQLVGVSASTLQAYVTTVLTSQGTALTILNNVPTVNIGGATFFVGYGPNGTAMINGGINRSAFPIPAAAQTCQPQAPQTGWWWNPSEGGRGFSIEKHGNSLFFASFLYDETGRSTWLVSSGPASLEGSLFVGDLLSVAGGQSLSGPYKPFTSTSKQGTMTMTFNSATNGTIVWPGGAVPIERQPFVPGGLSLTPIANQPESGWWWNDQESGRGFFMEWQGALVDVAGYMYDDAGNPTWYITVANMSADGKTLNSNWWTYAGGQTLTGAYKPATQTSSNFAPVTITFTGTSTAIMTLPGGRTTALKRQRF